MIRRYRDSGFALVIVLLVIVISGTVLASCARYSCQKAIEASKAQRELQIRWGSLSCKEVILNSAEAVLQESIDGEVPALVERSNRYLSLSFGGLAYHLLLSDEQAKMNVNTTLRYRGAQGVAESLVALQQDMPLHLLQRGSNKETGQEDSETTSYSFFDDLLVYDHPTQLVSLVDPTQRISSKITFWTDGQINFRRASIQVLQEAVKGLVDDSLLGELLQIRESLPDCTLGEALSQMEMKSSQRNQLLRYITDQSNCYSLWVVVDEKTRLWHRLYVSSPRGFVGDQMMRSYAW